MIKNINTDHLIKVNLGYNIKLNRLLLTLGWEIEFWDNRNEINLVRMDFDFGPHDTPLIEIQLKKDINKN